MQGLMLEEEDAVVRDWGDWNNADCWEFMVDCRKIVVKASFFMIVFFEC